METVDSTRHDVPNCPGWFVREITVPYAEWTLCDARHHGRVVASVDALGHVEMGPYMVPGHALVELLRRAGLIDGEGPSAQAWMREPEEEEEEEDGE